MMDVHDDLVAALAGRYEIERELGRGGMATVYLARDVRHDRHVALKVLRPDLASSLGAERFVREINIAARLSHPHILALYDSGTAGSALYYVMPHVDGETLRQRLEREHQLPLDEALAITRQIASALDYAHGHGVIHRDIKPENILMLDDHVLIADFGLARALYTATSPRLTGTAVAVGTPAYMSPEQAAADPQVDGRTDLYSLACVLFEMVTGSPPFHGATVQALMMHHLNSPPPSICAQRKACPPWVDEAVKRALEKMPADRFRTAGQFVRALEGQSPGGTPAATQPVSTNVATPRERLFRRRIGVGVASGITLGGLLLFAWQSMRAGQRVATLDDGQYVLVPFEQRGDANAALGLAVTDRLIDALSEWKGVELITLAATGAAATRSLPLQAAPRASLRETRGSGARWLVSGSVTFDGDSLTVHASLHDAQSGDLVRTAMVRHAAARSIPRTYYRDLANQLLRTRDESPWSSPDTRRAPTLRAWQAYDRARDALARWDLDLATRELNTAIAADPVMAQAHLWLALLKAWTLPPSELVADAAHDAFALQAHLARGDAHLAAAQARLSQGDYLAACDAFRRAIHEDSADFRAWLGVGDCHARDSTVLPARASPSRHAFRSSYHSAALAYLRARSYMTKPHPTFIYDRLERVALSESFRYRPGRRAQSRGVEFGAFPALIADTIAFVPYPIGMMAAARPEVSPVSQLDAVDRNRQLLRSLYLQWTADAPSNAEAHMRLATLLEMTEELEPTSRGPSALREVVLARARTTRSTPPPARSHARTAAREDGTLAGREAAGGLPVAGRAWRGRQSATHGRSRGNDRPCPRHREVPRSGTSGLAGRAAGWANDRSALARAARGAGGEDSSDHGRVQRAARRISARSGTSTGELLPRFASGQAGAGCGAARRAHARRTLRTRLLPLGRRARGRPRAAHVRGTASR